MSRLPVPAHPCSVLYRVMLVALTACGLGAQAGAGGNVSLRVQGGKLVLAGDAAGNEILISPVDVGVGSLLGLGSTLVNGAPSATFSGVDDGFVIRLHGGDDRGVSVCGSRFDAARVLSAVRFGGGGGQDGIVLESACGIAPPGLLQDFYRDFEVAPDDGSFLGGEICARRCP